MAERWRKITCQEREDLVDRLGRSYNGFSDESGLRREIEALCEQADYANERGVWVWDPRRILGTEGGKP